MKLHIVSDLHLDFYKDHGRKYIDNLEPAEDTTLIMAGDTGEYEWLTDWAVDILTPLTWKYAHVAYVLGNHEFYRSSFPDTLRAFKDLPNYLPNFHCLENETVEIEGVKLSGATLWFRDNLMNERYARFMADFKMISDFTKYVYEANEQSREFLEGCKESDVIITHHLPFLQSVNRRYDKDPLNLFFLCEMGYLIPDVINPKLWVHGHTHVPCTYSLCNTRVICNPRGYPSERRSNEYYEPKRFTI